MRNISFLDNIVFEGGIMNKTILIKSISVVLLGSLLLALCTFAFKVCVKKEMRLTKTYIASRDIPPRTMIMDTDLLEVEVPKHYVLSDSFTNKEELIGKYTDIQGKIPAGSLFYKTMVYDKESLPDSPTTELKDGQAAYSLEVDLAKLGGPLVPGQRVDVYASFVERDSSVISGALLENVRLIAIKDYQGLNLDDPSSTKTPYLAVLAIQVEDVELVAMAEKRGDLKLVASSKTYDTNIEAKRAQDSNAVRYLEEEEETPVEEIGLYNDEE